MAYFALLWKARTIEKYRSNYEKAKLDSIIAANAELPRHTFGQKWKLYRYDSQRKINKIFRRLCPEGSKASNFFVYLKTDQTFANFLVKSVIGFVGGIVLTYFWFMFFVFQLSISLIHATIMSSIIGVALTLGLAFSYRVRCLVFLLIPQFFSRVGRYTLTCYALVLILTGPATNTMKNSEVLSGSLACGQEQVKSSVTKISKSMEKPLHLIKDTMDETMKKLKYLAAKMKELMVGVHRLTMSLAHVLQSSLLWLNSVQDICNAKLGTPYQHCLKVLGEGKRDKNLMKELSNFDYFASKACFSLKSVDLMCVVGEYAKSSIVATVKKKLQTYSEHIGSLVAVNARVRRSHGCCNTSSASQAAGGTVTEIRRRADPLLTWLSWSACLTSLFLLLIIFRAKYYQQMFQTRSRFDNRYVTKELRDLDFKRLKQGRETVLPLNTRERAKYVSTTSFRLLASERVHLTRSIVFMVITTFKLLIHMVADYSLYWVLMNIRFHGRFQTPLMPGDPTAGIQVAGSGPLAGIVRVLLEALSIPLSVPAPSPISCLPNPHPPDFQRYAQIGVLILLLWVFALFEPYGLRLRHVIMSRYQPERARQRAEWLYNHIIRTRGSFLKYARRKLHREYKYSSEERYTFRRWLNNFIPCRCIRYLLRIGPEEPHCLLCGTKHTQNDSDTYLKRCDTPSCPGTYCARCFMDIGQLCTICLSPEDYGDLSDVSLEKGSSDDSDGNDSDSGDRGVYKPLIGSQGFRDDKFLHENPKTYKYEDSPKATNNDSQEATTLNFDSSKHYVHTNRTFIQEYKDQFDGDSEKKIKKQFYNDSIIPVVVRDKERLLKTVQVPKEKLTGVINTMKLLTTKVADAKSNNQWNMHESKTFEYLVMNLMEPVDVFNKALIVRQTKLNDTDTQLVLHNEGKNESLKQLVPFLCAYPVNEITTNRQFKDPNPVTKDIPKSNIERKAGKLDLEFKKEQIINKELKVSKRDTKLIKRCITRAVKARVMRSDSVFEELRKRRIEFYKTKERHHKYHYRKLRFKNRHSYLIELKCRAYKIDRSTFSRNFPKEINKFLSANKCDYNSNKCLEKDNSLTEDVKCYVRSKSQELSNNVSSDIKPSNLRYPAANETPNDLQNRKKENTALKTIHDKVDRNQNEKCSFNARLWIRSKTVFMTHKLRSLMKRRDPILPNNIKNHKRRKKPQIPEQNTIAEPNLRTIIKAKQDNDDARNFRLSRYLKDNQEWFEEELQKESRVLKDRHVKTKRKISNASLNNFLLRLKEKAMEPDIKNKLCMKANDIAKKKLVRELKKKSKEEQKLKRKLKMESNKHKTIKDTTLVQKTRKANDNKISNEYACYHEKNSISPKSGEGISLKPIREETSLKETHSYVPPKVCVPNCLNFIGFNEPPIDLSEESIDLDKIFADDNKGNTLKERNSTELIYCQCQHDTHRPLLRQYDIEGITEPTSEDIIEITEPNDVAKEKHVYDTKIFGRRKKKTDEKKCMELERKESECEMEKHKIISPKKKRPPEKKCVEPIKQESECELEKHRILLPKKKQSVEKKCIELESLESVRKITSTPKLQKSQKKKMKNKKTLTAPEYKEFGCDGQEFSTNDDDAEDGSGQTRGSSISDTTQVTSKTKTKKTIEKPLKLVASDAIFGMKNPVNKLRHYYDTLFFGGSKSGKRDKRIKHDDNRPFTDGTRSPMHKMTQAQLTKLRHCDVQCEPENCICGRDVGTMVSAGNTCTCAAQCSEHRRPETVNVGTIHHNALRKLKDKQTQYEISKKTQLNESTSYETVHFVDQLNETSRSFEAFRSYESPRNTDYSAYLPDLTEYTGGIKTDTTICSLVTVDYALEKSLKGRRRNVEVTKANQSTSTEITRSVDASTVTSDWWSPILEKKTITQNRQQGTNYQAKWKLDKGIETDGKYVCFKSNTKIIQQDESDILSPSRYLMASQKYYNELFTSGVCSPPLHVRPLIQIEDKGCDAVGNFRNIRKTLKTKRLEECYSPSKRTLTSCFNLKPVSWRKVEAKDSPAHVPRRHTHRSSNVQIGRKSRKLHDKQEKGVGKAIKRSDRFHASRTLSSHETAAFGPCNSTNSN